MVKKNNKVLYISIISISVILIGIVVWGFLTNWKFWNYKKEKTPKTSKLPKLPKYKSNIKIPEGNEIEMKDPKKKGFKIGQEIEIGTEIRTIVGFKPSTLGPPSFIIELDSKISDHPSGTVIRVIKLTPTGKFNTEYCQKYNKNGECVTCFSDLPLKNGICIQSDKCKSENNCKSCNKTGNKCEKCDDGYIPVTDGKCCLRRKTYPVQENEHYISKCCDTELCDDKKCCSENNKTCAVQPNSNHLCCDGRFASQTECCGKDQILDNNGKCCDKDKIDKNGDCCLFDLLSVNGKNVCRKKCSNDLSCELTKKCSANNQRCETIDCNIDDVPKTFSADYVDGDDQDNKDKCQITGDNIKFENRTCKYPVYKYYNNDDYKFLYINNTFSEQLDKIKHTYAHSTQQTNGSCQSTDCSGTFKNHVCTTKELVPIKDINICPYEDKDRCCKIRDDYTGQVCPLNNKCIITTKGEFLGKCVNTDTKCTGVKIPPYSEIYKCNKHGQINGNIYNNSCHCKCDAGYYGTLCSYQLKDYTALVNYLKNNKTQIDTIDVYNGIYTVNFTDYSHDSFTKDALTEYCSKHEDSSCTNISKNYTALVNYLKNNKTQIDTIDVYKGKYTVNFTDDSYDFFTKDALTEYCNKHKDSKFCKIFE